MNNDSMAAYEAAAKIHQLADAREGSPEAAELAALVEAVKDWEERGQGAGAASAPGNYANPRSAHSSGPHPPYDVNDQEGAAAEKHAAGASVHQESAAPANRPSGNIRST